jgi:hypothetical protein
MFNINISAKYQRSDERLNTWRKLAFKLLMHGIDSSGAHNPYRPGSSRNKKIDG